jgi:hypothetical protein
MSIKATFWLSGVMVLAGCSGDDEPFRKETTGVTGQVIVDGVPVPATAQLRVTCHNVNGMDQEHPTISSALTGEDGKFQISTYISGDGIPAGDYTLTFMWGKMNLISGSYAGPDKLNGRYSDAKTSEYKFTVTTGEDAAAVDLGTIKLTTE